jgi:hypothetical protein
MPESNYRLPGWCVRVSAPSPEVLDYLATFYDPVPDGPVDAHVLVTPELADEYGWPEFRHQPVRLLIREHWLTWLRSRHTAFNLHASAVDDGEKVIVFVGHRRAGKTTLMLDAVGNFGMDVVTNDNLIVFEAGGEILLTTLPTYIKVRAEPAHRFATLLTARAAGWPHNQRMWRYYRDTPEGFPFHGEAMIAQAGFGPSHQPLIPLSQRDLVLVEVGFLPAGGSSVLSHRDFTASFVADNLKWSSGADVARLVHRFAEEATHYAWQHHGEVDALFEALAAGSVRR